MMSNNLFWKNKTFQMLPHLARPYLEGPDRVFFPKDEVIIIIIIMIIIIIIILS